MLSGAASHLIQGLLSVDPRTRLGFGPKGIQSIMSHKWFADIDWDELEAKLVPAPFIPAAGYSLQTTSLYNDPTLLETVINALGDGPMEWCKEF